MWSSILLVSLLTISKADDIYVRPACNFANQGCSSPYYKFYNTSTCLDELNSMHGNVMLSPNTYTVRRCELDKDKHPFRVLKCIASNMEFMDCRDWCDCVSSVFVGQTRSECDCNSYATRDAMIGVMGDDSAKFSIVSGQSLVWECVSHPEMRGQFIGESPSCPAAYYYDERRMYNKSAPLCVDGLVESEKICRCTSTQAIDTYMVLPGEYCINGTRYVEETCASYTCPSGYTKNESSLTVGCGYAFCQGSDRDTCCELQTCGPGYGYDSVSDTCIDCNDDATYNAADDQSPCGPHTECGRSERFVYSSTATGQCETCPAGTQTSDNGFAIVCDECAENYYVVSGACLPCESGSVNAPGDIISGNDTVCDRNCSILEGPWSNCSSECPVGTRSRQIFVTVEASGSGTCDYVNGEYETGPCNGCPTNCTGTWSAWSTCSATCGGGTQTRTFTIEQDAAYGGKACEHGQGESSSRDCNQQACTCATLTCPVGYINDASEGDTDCAGPICDAVVDLNTCCEAKATCSSYTCPEGYGSDVSKLDTYCVGSTCDANDRDTCCGQSVDCIASWSAWSVCSAICGGGTQTRSFTIAQEAAYGGQACEHGQGESSSRDCNTQHCKCSSYTCPFGYVANAEQVGTDCVAATCDAADRDTCCEPKAGCTTYTCPARYVDKADKASLFCAATNCDTGDRDTCCDPTAVCSSYTCPFGYVDKADKASLFCAAINCDTGDRDTCCDLLAKCSTYTCPFGYVANAEHANTDCAQATCDVNDRDTCCEPRTCGPGYGYDNIADACVDCNDDATYNAADDQSPCGAHDACSRSERFVYSSTELGQCEDCPTGTQTSDNGFATVCDECAENFYVSSGVCTACASGSTNEAGDNMNGADTVCDTIVETVHVDFVGATFLDWSVRIDGGAALNDPTVEICLGHRVSVQKSFTSYSHPLKIVPGDLDWNTARNTITVGGDIGTGTESAFYIHPTVETTYTYICTAHSGMIGKIKWSNSYCATPVATCDSHMCPSGYVPKSSAASLECASSGCTTDTCCEAGYNFGMAEIALCPDDPVVQIVWAGTHNIQETEGHDCGTNTIGEPLAFIGSETLEGDVGFLPAGSRRNISAAQLSLWDSTRYFRCTKHCSGARLQVTCNRSAPAASCDTFTCPSGYEIKNSTEPREGESDLHRCCKYNRSEFQYVAQSCSPELCYEFSLIHGHRICNWNSGTCASCGYCTSYELSMPSQTKFIDGPNCAGSCRNYLYLPENDDSRKRFCTWSNCKGCEYCQDTFYDKLASSTVCDDKCVKYWQLQVNGVEKYEHYCLWSSCRDCTLCYDERIERETTLYNSNDANCDLKCSKYWELQRVSRIKYYDKYDSHCLWSSCRGCHQCQTEKAVRESTQLALVEDSGDGLSCNVKCAKYWELKTFGYERYRDFCFWGSCMKCNICQDERALRETSTFAVVPDAGDGKYCASSCKDYYELREKGTYDNYYADFCLWGSCAKCAHCESEKTERENFQYAVKNTGCEANCKDYAVLKIRHYNNGQYEDFCTWSNCENCAQCKNDQLQREARDYRVRELTDGKQCQSICKDYAKLKLRHANDGQYAAFCLWGSCNGCRKCLAEKSRRATVDYRLVDGAEGEERCSTRCKNYAELAVTGANDGQYTGFCQWAECAKCRQCIAEEKWRTQKSFKVLSADTSGNRCDADCKDLRKRVLTNDASALNFCLLAKCARCPGCQGNRPPKGRRLTRMGIPLKQPPSMVQFKNDMVKLLTEPSLADVRRELTLNREIPSSYELQKALSRLLDIDTVVETDDLTNSVESLEPSNGEFERDVFTLNELSDGNYEPSGEEFEQDYLSMLRI